MIGTLFVSGDFVGDEVVPVLVRLHGAYWVGEHYVATLMPTVPLVTVELGAGSRVYGDAFADPAAFETMLEDAETAMTWMTGAPTRIGKILLASFSAGYGATRAILGHPALYDRVDGVLLADGLHASYVAGRSPPRSGDARPELVADDLDVFVRFAADAVAGKKRMWITHSEVFPGTYASTTETADYLLDRLGLQRTPVLMEGPIGMQQLSDVEQGGFHLAGFAGNSAPDHLDHLFALGGWLRGIRRWLTRP